MSFWASWQSTYFVVRVRGRVVSSDLKAWKSSFCIMQKNFSEDFYLSGNTGLLQWSSESRTLSLAADTLGHDVESLHNFSNFSNEAENLPSLHVTMNIYVCSPEMISAEYQMLIVPVCVFHITTLMSSLLLQDNYILFWNVYLSCCRRIPAFILIVRKHTWRLKKYLGQMWWRRASGRASEGNLHFILRLSADSSQRDASRNKLLLPVWSWRYFLAADGGRWDCGQGIYETAPPIVINGGGCNWAESVLLSDFLTVKRAKLIWVILFI